MNSPNGSTRSHSQSSHRFSYISFAKDSAGHLKVNLFDKIAKQTAQDIADSKPTENKPTQLRRFFDEIIMWDEKLSQCKNKDQKFNEYLPFIRMLNAKAAYANGRKHINENFVDLLSHCIDQVKTAEDVHILKLFFEAFTGFYKLEKN